MNGMSRCQGSPGGGRRGTRRAYSSCDSMRQCLRNEEGGQGRLALPVTDDVVLAGIGALAGEPVKYRLIRLFVASRASPHVREAERLWILKSRPAVIVDVEWPGKQAGFLADDLSHPPLVDAMRTGP